MNKRRIVMTFLVGIIVIFFAVIFLIKTRHYEKWSDVHEMISNVSRYENCIEKYGFPDKKIEIEVEDNLKSKMEDSCKNIILVYPNMFVNYLSCGNMTFRFVQIYKGCIYLGPNKISIGMSHKEVSKSMKKTNQSREVSLYFDEGRIESCFVDVYQDKNYTDKIYLIYDEDEKIEYINITYGNNR